MPIYGPHGQLISAAEPGAPGPLSQLVPANNNWFLWAQTFLEQFRNPDDISVATYEKMVTTDESVFSGVEFVTLAALARLGEYTHESEQIQTCVRDAIEGMRGTWNEQVAEILTAIWAGYSVTEILWRVEPGKIALDGLQTLHPATVDFDIHTSGPDKNRLKRIVQWRWTQYESDIPVSKAIVFSHRKRFGNLYGQSRLRPAYKNWFLKDLMLKAWALTLDRYGSPIAVANVPNVNIQCTEDGLTMGQYVGKVLDNLSGRGSLVFDDQTKVDLKYAPRGFGADFESAVNYCNKMIYRALLLPSLVGDHGETGSYSLGQKHFDMFYLSLVDLLHQLIEVLVEQLVRPLIEFNFGPQKDYGDFQVAQFEADEKKLFAEVFEKLVNTGVMSTQRLDDMNHIRTEMGLPLLSEEDLEPLITPEELAAATAAAMPQKPPSTDKPKKVSTASSLLERQRQRTFRRATRTERHTYLVEALTAA